MPVVSVPGHGDVEFPDSMKDEEIVAAIKKLQPPAQPSTGQAIVRGGLQGASMGFGDELAGAYSASQKYIKEHPEFQGVPDADLYATAMASPEDYRATRDQSRKENAAAEAAHRTAYMASQIGGAMLPGAIATVATGGSGAVAPGTHILRGALAAAQGGLQGAGYSEADNASGLASDSALGAGLGLAGHAVGEALNAGGRSITSAARGRAGSAISRAAQQAAKEETGNVGSIAGKFGGEVQKGSRYTENVGRLAPSGTAAQQAEVAAQAPVIQNLEQQVLGSTLKQLPDQAAAITAREAELRAAQSALPQAIAARTAELSKPTFLKDAASYAKGYAEPMIAAYATDRIGRALDVDDSTRRAMDGAAGLVFSRTRAGKALANRFGKPGNQAAIFGAAGKVTPWVAQLLKRAAAAASAPATEYELSP